MLGAAVRADRVALDRLLLRDGQAVQRGLLGGDELAQGVLVVGELGLERRDPALGALQLLLDAGQLAGVGEQLCRLRVAVAGQLHRAASPAGGRPRDRLRSARRRSRSRRCPRRWPRRSGPRWFRAAWNWALAWFTPARTWASLVCAAESCSLGLVELLGDLVVLRRELVHLGLDLSHGRLRRGAGHGGEDGQPADRHQPGHDRDATAEPGLAARWPRNHVPTTLLVIPRVIACSSRSRLRSMTRAHLRLA